MNLEMPMEWAKDVKGRLGWVFTLSASRFLFSVDVKINETIVCAEETASANVGGFGFCGALSGGGGSGKMTR